MLRAGVIGLGVGEQHIAGYRAHPKGRVTALCDISDAKREMARERYPDCRIEADPEAILRDPEIDVVSVAGYDDSHAAQVLSALREDKHVFVEKPLCLYPEEAREIRAELNRRPHLKLSSNLILRRCPRFIELRRRIAAGDLGEVFYLEASYNYGRIHKITEGWRGRIDYYSVVYGGAVHMIDLLRWLTGERIVEVSAFGSRIATRRSQFRYDDTVVGIFRCQGGAIGKVVSNYACVTPHFHELAVYGTGATFLNQRDRGLLTVSRDPDHPPETVPGAYPGAQKGDLVASFLDEILGSGTAEVTTEDVFATMSVCFAMEQAAKESRKVKVEYL